MYSVDHNRDKSQQSTTVIVFEVYAGLDRGRGGERGGHISASAACAPSQKFDGSRGAPGGAARRPRILVHLQCTSDSASLRGIPR